LTMIFWFACWGVSTAELVFLQLETDARLEVKRLDMSIDTYDKRIAMMEPKPVNPPATQPATQPRLLTDFKETRQRLVGQKPEAESSYERWKKWHGYFYAGKTFLPKTSETIDLLNRFLVSREETEQLMSGDESKRGRDRDRDKPKKSDDEEVNVPKGRTDVEVQNQLRDRSVGWIVGTSLIFEAAVLCLAAWVFSRRDF
jgi:hypothetical protein